MSYLSPVFFCFHSNRQLLVHRHTRLTGLSCVRYGDEAFLISFPEISCISSIHHSEVTVPCTLWNAQLCRFGGIDQSRRPNKNALNVTENFFVMPYQEPWAGTDCFECRTSLHLCIIVPVIWFQLLKRFCLNDIFVIYRLAASDTRL